MKNSLRLFSILGVSTALTLTSSPAAVWIGGTSGNDWNVGANWDGGVPNGAIADVKSGTAVLSTPAPNILRLRIGALAADNGTVIISSSLTGSGATEIARAGTGTLIINAGANFQVGSTTTATYRFGVDPGSLGIGIHNGGTVTSGGTFSVGVGGTGQYTLAGGAINALNNATIAASAGGVGTYTQSSGTLTVGNSSAGGAFFVGQNGTATMNLSGGRVLASSLSLAPVLGSSTSAVLNQTGGEIDIVNGPNQTPSSTLGLLIASDRATYSISGGSLLVADIDMSGDFNVTGNDATITVQDSLSLTSTGTITFTFNDEGITALAIGGIGTFADGSIININGSAFTGPNGTYNVIDAASFGGVGASTVNLSGFGAGSFSTWDAANGVLSVTVVPEPSTALLALSGGVAWLVLRRRRKTV